LLLGLAGLLGVRGEIGGTGPPFPFLPLFSSLISSSLNSIITAIYFSNNISLSQTTI
jgi:hypothetical protein